jgi:alpha/beta hydrolase fold.
MNRFLCEKTGCKIIAIDYAKAPEQPFPAALNPIYAVVKHVYRNAGTFGVDPERMAIGGYSAGGNLATATCLLAAGKREFSFKGQVLIYPPLNLATNPFDKPCSQGAIRPAMASFSMLAI